MKQIIFKNVLRPLVDRIGSNLAVFLVGIGMTQPDAQSLVLGLTAAAGVSFDLIARRIGKGHS
jgi:hypothetical protein